jgi:Ca2+-transporting ATPase
MSMEHQGLSNDAAASRLRRDGYNELPAAGQRGWLRIFLEVVREPMFLLLLAAGGIYLLLGEPQDAAMLLGFVLVSMAITIYQERKTERVLEALRDLSSPRALVIRDGEQRRIAGREVVVDDLLVLEEGDRIAADGALVEAHDLLVDESLLTGESVAVGKEAGAAGEAGVVRSGSVIVQGGGLARVTAIGADTEIGRIGRALQEIDPGRSPLQDEIAMLVKRFAAVAVVIAATAFVLYGATRHDWYAGMLAGITLAMSLLPEEFTLVLAVFMALGAWRLTGSQVLARRTAVIETLGAATALCVDKTGTITQNRMSVKCIVIDGVEYALDRTGDSSDPAPEAVCELLRQAVLASEILPFDPMEKAFHQSAERLCPSAKEASANWDFVHEYPLTGELPAMTHVWREPGDGLCLVAAKGAPEAVARMCGLDPQARTRVLADAAALAARGMRVLAVAKARHPGEDWPASPEAFDFAWLGLVGLADPLRPAVPGAIQACHAAGISVVMITGDHPATAQAIARDAGLPSQKVVTGAELDAMDDAQLAAALVDTHVFARVRPEQKLRLVEALRAAGQVVAMTGDGVNDAPALKAAHIGIGMGQRGTDVAREASALVLLNDDFNSIVEAVRIGRRIYDNLRKAMVYIVAVHMPIAGIALLPLVLGTPLVFAPVHIVFLEMIINPACSIVFESEHAEPAIMQRPPRAPSERLFGFRSMVVAVLQGGGLLAVVAIVYGLCLSAGMPAGQVRTMTFCSLVAGNLSLILAGRSSTRSALRLLAVPNRAQWWVVIGAALALLAAASLPALRQLFHFALLPPAAAVYAIVAGLAAIIWFELVKWMTMRMTTGMRRTEKTLESRT